MKLSVAKTESYIKQWKGEPKIVLLYGPDEGLVRFRAQHCAKATLGEQQNDPFARVQMSGPALAETPSRLIDEVNSPSLMGGNRVIMVEDADKNTVAALEALLAGGVAEPGVVVIIQAGSLDARDSLRKSVEASSHAMAIPCYAEEEHQVARSIQQRLQGKMAPADVPAVSHALAEKCLGNRMVLEQQLEKLDLYFTGTEQWTADAVLACMGDATELALDSVLTAVVDGNLSQLAAKMHKAQQEAVPMMVILRTLLRFFMRIEEAQQSLGSGVDIDEVVRAMRPPIFFKQVPLFKKALKRWGAPRVMSKTLSLLFDTERDLKQTGAVPEIITERAVMKLSVLPQLLAKRAA